MLFRKKDKSLDTLDLTCVPKHIGIIMDGNGRWAKRRGLPRSAGHRQGAKTLEMIADYCGSIGVEVITAYAFSTENWSRPDEEVNALMDLLYDYLSQAKTRFADKNCRLLISGDMSRFSDKIRTAMKDAMDVTKDGSKITINLALNYGGRDEIVRATKALCSDVVSGSKDIEKIDEATFGEYLDTANLPEVDLIIRPSGEQRLSNFLLWQAAYAEFWFNNINWPDFSEKHMEQAVLDYQKRNRRFGKV